MRFRLRVTSAGRSSFAPSADIAVALKAVAAGQTCVMDEWWEVADPEAGPGSIIFDMELTHDASLEGEYGDFALLFEPPSMKPVGGYLKITGEEAVPYSPCLVVTCGSADCSGGIDANERRGDDPSTSITKTLEKQCDDSEPITCQLECYGWSP